MQQSLHGALLIDKPLDISSFGALALLQKSMGLPRKSLPKFGHGGTLDPFATGLLVVCIGEATKLTRYFLHSKKHYSATLRFGEHTVSGDLTDPVLERSEVLPGSLQEIQLAANALAAVPYSQTPPMHSALKQDGKPLYELARQGITVDREPRICQLENFKISAYEAPTAKFEVSCSAGTYIRVLAQDLAKNMGTLGHLTELRRLGSGPLSIRSALPLAEACTLSPSQWTAHPAWIPFDQILLGTFPAVELNQEEAAAVTHGNVKRIQELQERLAGQMASADYTQWMYQNQLLAVAHAQNGVERVFPPQLRK